MTEYSVKWDVDVEAASPYGAARQAMRVIGTPGLHQVNVTRLDGDGNEIAATEVQIQVAVPA